MLTTRRAVVLGAATTSLATVLAGPAASQDGGSFDSGGRSIAIERFDGAGGGRRPAVVMLHGADGLTRGDRYRVGAQILAASGYHVFLLHYLDRTEQSRASFSTIGSNFAVWAETVRDALSFVARQPGVDRSRLGLIGFSLGGALAVAVSAQDRRVDAVVNYFGFLPEWLAEGARRLPPTLVLHGARDALVPVSNAYALEALLKRLRVPHDVHVYADQAHGFYGAAQLDAAQRTAAFLARHLGGGGARAASALAAAV